MFTAFTSNKTAWWYVVGGLFCNLTKKLIRSPIYNNLHYLKMIKFYSALSYQFRLLVLLFSIQKIISHRTQYFVCSLFDYIMKLFLVKVKWVLLTCFRHAQDNIKRTRKCHNSRQTINCLWHHGDVNSSNSFMHEKRNAKSQFLKFSGHK